MIGGIEETSASFEARSAPRSYPTDLHRPRAVRWRPRGRRRSVGRGGHRPAIEPRKPIPGCRRRFERGRQHVSDAPSQRPNDPAWSKNLACADAPCAGTGRSRDRPFGNCRRSASGRRGAVADDARSREVRLCHSSWEPDEQSGHDRRRGRGAKGRGQGECEPAKHAPDSEPGKCVTRAGAHTASRNEKKRFAVTHPRWEKLWGGAAEVVAPSSSIRTDGGCPVPQVNDLSRSLAAFDPISTLVVIVEMSKTSWLVSGVVPVVERQSLKKLDPDAAALVRLIERWRIEAVRAGRLIRRIALAYEAGRDGFWLARWLFARGIEAHVIHSASVAVSREHKRDGSSGCGDIDARIPGLVAR